MSMTFTPFLGTNLLRKLAMPFLLIAMVTTLQAGGKSSREEAVLKFEHAWADAWVKADLKRISSMVTDDFVEVDPSGKILTKAEHVAQFASGAIKLESLVLSNLRVRFHGNVAIVTGLADDKGTQGGQKINGTYRFTDVLVRRGGEWKAVSTQSTQISP